MSHGKFAFAVIGLLIVLLGCNQTTWPERSVYVADSVVVTQAQFWPASVRYVAIGETAVVELQGVERGFFSSYILQCSLHFRDSTSDSATLQPYVRIAFPANPASALDLTGLDTAVKQIVSSRGGSLLFLQSTMGVRTDTVRIVSAKVQVESLTYVSDTTGRLVKGRYTFLDSTVVHPRRTLRIDSLLPCETLQGAVFTRQADNLRIRFHLLRLDSTLHSNLSPCSGLQSDSVEVVSDRFAFPGSP